MTKREKKNIDKAVAKLMEVRNFLTAERQKEQERIQPLMDKIIPLLWDAAELIQPKN